jgi:CO dehydrogenase maturation factor
VNSETRPLWLAVAGKGGAGKSVVSGTLARVLARRGHKVLAVDSDPMPGMSLVLGAQEPDRPPLMDAVEKPEGKPWRLKPGIGPARAVSRFSTAAPDGVRLLQLGKADKDGLIPVNPAVNGFLRVVHRLHEPASMRAWTIVGDLPAGPRHPAAGFSPYANLYLVVLEARSQSALTARRVARIAREHRHADVLFVANKIASDEDRERAERLLGEPIHHVVPADPAVAAAERDGIPVLDASPDAPAVQAIERLADALEGRTVGAR